MTGTTRMTDRGDRALVMTMFAGALALYAATLCPYVFWDDAGELTAAASCLGIPHPPGHPLYSILGKCFTIGTHSPLPLGGVAARVNFMSAFFGATAVALLALLLVELLREATPLRRRIAAGFGAAAFAISVNLWDQATVAENTTIHATFLLGLLWLVARMGRLLDAGRPAAAKGILPLFTFVYGVSLANHVSGGLYIPAFAVALFILFRRTAFTARDFIPIPVAFLLGPILYALLPIRSAANPPMDWGNPETWGNFIWVVTFRQYSGNLAKSYHAPGWGDVARLLEGFWREFPPGVLLLSAAGAAMLFRRRRVFLGLGIFIILLLAALTLNQAFIGAYLVPAFAVLALLAGVGLAGIMTAAAARRNARAGMMTAGAGLALVAVFLVLRYPENDRSRYSLADRFGREVLDSVPRDGLLLVGSGDATFIPWYLQYCENYRPDVILVNRNGWGWPGYLDALERDHPGLLIPAESRPWEIVLPPFLGLGLAPPANLMPEKLLRKIETLAAANLPRRAVRWELLEENMSLLERMVPAGVTFRLADRPAPAPDVSPAAFFHRLDAILGDPRRRDPRTSGRFATALLHYAFYYHNPKIGKPLEALRCYQYVLAISPDIAQAHAAIGEIRLRQLKDPDGALAAYEEAIRLNPLYSRYWVNLGFCRGLHGNRAGEMEAYRRAVAMDPDDPMGLWNLGDMIAQDGEFREALPLLEKAFRLAPDENHRRALESLYLRLGEYQKAAALKSENGNQ
ncbi:MAG: DUF2723 domain-containing protein [Planctomycetota bacterium]